MSIREQRLAMAQSRALDEQSERYNPINAIRNPVVGMGGSATPIMGLSQFRGGKPRKSRAKKIVMMGGMDDPKRPSAFRRVVGAPAPAPAPPAPVAPAPVAPAPKMFDASMPICGSTNHYAPAAKRRKQGEGRKRSSSSDDEAEAQGKHLAQHLHSLHGGSFLKRFVGGMDTGRYEGEGSGGAPRMEVAELSGPGFEAAGGGDEYDGCGGGTLTITHGGRAKKVKRIVGAGDGRRKRAEVVKKVMAEKGMKMIEASKYVKEHGLYKG
ncbi:MAG: hypothetical protein YSLV5_ORF13 [Yellowstone Lake virophage 5]|uniref:Uncharacterized protein n=1 Tax=Yellowstone Lake virophage 5 TaxID=1557033 RepID=A0A0A0RJT0_9VIRU|nr:MAG: hypothetical protein ASQ69_gp13 [Yellowstone Lake virophage 5]AIW01871.1 MAG: hypothetical protein YSLV5_ORF13 [Yellowstone Lake virophage 5]